MIKGKRKTEGKVDRIWVELQEKLPWKKNPQDKAKRNQIWQ